MEPKIQTTQPDVHAAAREHTPVLVRFRDLSIHDGPFRARLLDAFTRLLDHGQLILGEEVDRFEAAIAEHCGTRFAVGVASGTSALYLALKGLGIGPGDEVITTPFSWVATLNAIASTGATPVFADISDDLNIDPAAVAAKITERTKAIVPVHFTGRLCDMTALSALANAHGLLLVEDAAQAFGARAADGRAAGSFGHAAGFSFNPMKVLPGFGEAGVVTTNDPALAERLISLRYLGTVNRESCVEIELNHKIDSLQAALLVASLPTLDNAIDARARVAEAYGNGLKDIAALSLPPRGARDTLFFDYTLQTDGRDDLAAFLVSRGIECKIRHPILMPDQPAYPWLHGLDLPVARRAVDRILCLPCHDKLSNENVDLVIAAVREFHNRPSLAP
ncbi:MAG: DegT/DnrJ/EryC1/StrS family aminotransferase [Rhodospirillales bacterium]